jgi:hypothetical protein
MKQGGKIEGRIVDAATNAGIEEAGVCAYTQSTFGGCALTDSAGDYRIQGIPTGAYVVEFWAEFLGYETRYFNETADFGGASLVSVVAPNTVTGINARLSKPGARVTPVAPTTTVLPAPAPAASQPKPKPHCKKSFKRVKRHGRTVCVRKHKKKRRP